MGTLLKLAIFANIYHVSVKTVAYRQKLAAYRIKHCWRAFWEVPTL